MLAEYESWSCLWIFNGKITSYLINITGSYSLLAKQATNVQRINSKQTQSENVKATCSLGLFSEIRLHVVGGKWILKLFFFLYLNQHTFHIKHTWFNDCNSFLCLLYDFFCVPPSSWQEIKCIEGWMWRHVSDRLSRPRTSKHIIWEEISL